MRLPPKAGAERSGLCDWLRVLWKELRVSGLCALALPAVRKMRQAIGRLIRSDGDRGMAVILDRRVASLDGLDAKLTSDPVAEVRRFFQSH